MYSNVCIYVYIYIYIYTHTYIIYMRNLLGWLETRLAQKTLTCMKPAEITLSNKQLDIFKCNSRSFESFEETCTSLYTH